MAEPKAEPKWELNQDLKTVTITFPTDPPVALRLDLLGVENIIKNLGDFHAAMKPEVPKNFAVGQKVEVIPDPAWVTEPDLLMGNSILHIRDPRYGWLHYLIPREEAKKLGILLQNQADAPSPGPKQGQPS